MLELGIWCFLSRTALDENPRINQSQFMYRIIGSDGKEYGPISADQLRQWIAEGRANAATRVLPEGSPEWKLLGSFAEFSMLLATSTIQATPSVFPTGPLPAQKSNAFATTGLVLGIISITIGFCCCYGLPFNVTGLVFSIIALRQIKTDPERYGGKGMAIAGLVLCLLSLLIMILFIMIAGFSAGWDEMTHHAYKL